MGCRVIVVKTAEDIPTCPVDGKPTCVYWNMCGLAQSIRMALALARVDFVDVRIEAGRSGDEKSNKQAWFEKKPALLNGAFPFANLPYYMDDSVNLTQSNAILKYIGRTHELLGPSGKEHLIDLAFDQLTDLDNSFVKPAYYEGRDGLKVWYETQVSGYLAQWERFLGSRKFLLGASVTVADLKLYETLRKIRIVGKEICNDNDASRVGGSIELSDFMKRVEALPSIKAYMESSEYMSRPLNNPHALFN